MVEAARRVHSLYPLSRVDPWTLPMTRGALAREVHRLRSDRSAGEDPLLSLFLDDLEEELAHELFRPRRQAGRGDDAGTARGEVRLEIRDRRRGALRAVGRGDLALRIGERFSWRQQVEIDSRGGDDPDFIGKEWKRGVTGHFTHAALTWRSAPLRIHLGRREVAWGNGLSGSLLLQDRKAPFDQIGLSVRKGSFSGAAFVAPLDDFALDGSSAARRYISGHRIVYHRAGRFRIGLSETVVYGGEGRVMDWAYANPLTIYYGVQWNRNRNDNVLWSIDAYLRLSPSVDLFGEFLADDFQYDLETEPNQTSFLAGARIKKIPGLRGLFLDGEYVRVNNWVYGHEVAWNRYTYGNTLLGHPLGPDADRVLVRLYFRPAREWAFLAEYERRREGEGAVDDSRDAAVPHDTGFLTGDVTITDRPAFEIRFHPRAGRRFFARLERTAPDDWLVSAGFLFRTAATRRLD